ncbi:hypothetical protein ACH4E7_26670 [Kitasatospora sp. NPDC018058]
MCRCPTEISGGLVEPGLHLGEVAEFLPHIRDDRAALRWSAEPFDDED